MQSVEVMHKHQIDTMSHIIYQQSQSIAELHARTTRLGTQMQHTQLHLNQIDARTIRRAKRGLLHVSVDDT